MPNLLADKEIFPEFIARKTPAEKIGSMKPAASPTRKSRSRSPDLVLALLSNRLADEIESSVHASNVVSLQV